MQEGTQDDGSRLTQLADFWLYEHLLSLPKSIASDEIIEHLGAKFPYREVESASLPAPISARLFLRHLRHAQLPITDWDEQLQLLGLMHQISCKQAQFRSRAVAAAMDPPTELLTEVLMQLLCVKSDPGYRGEPDDPQQPLTSTAVASAAEGLLSSADVSHLLDDELLQNRLSLLEQLLRGMLEPAQLQRHLQQAFPSDAVEEQLREYADKAWAALGQTSLQRYQTEVLAGRLPWDPMQHFAALLPVATQAALDEAAFATDAHMEEAEPQQQQPQQRQRQHARGTGPVVLLGEATAPVLGELEDLEAAAGSSQGERTGHGGRQQQAAAAAAAGVSPQPKASPVPRASPKQAKATLPAAVASPAAAAAAAGGGAVDAGKHSRKARAGSKFAKDTKQEGVRPSRKQLQLEPSNAAGAAAAANSDADDEPAAAAAAAAAAEGGEGGRKSCKQQEQQQTESLVESEPTAPAAAAGNENMPPPAAAAAGSGGRKRGRKAQPVEEPAAAAGLGSSEEQTRDSSQPNVIEGVELASAAAQDDAAAAAAGCAQNKSTAAGFMKVFSKPLDGLAAAAGGLAAAVRGSPALGGPKERKMCGAPQEGVKSRTVPWESPFGGSIDSPEDTPRDKSAKSPAGAAAAAAAGAAGRPAADALKRKRAQADGDRGRVAAARAAARGADSGNTEYQDAQEEAGSESEGAPRGSPRRQKPQQRQQDDDDDSSIDDPDSEKDESQSDEFDYDDSSDEEGGAQQQRQQKRRPGRPRKEERQQQRKPGRPAGASAAAAAAGGRPGGARVGHGGGAGARAAAYDPDFDAFEERGGPKKRRKFNRWSAEEEALLIQLVAQEGEGQWALIHQLGGDGFNRRTQVDLKDKWRNLKKKGAVSD